MEKQVKRTCMGCNQKKDKKGLLRIVKNKENVVSVDETGKMQGRGAYICKEEECLEKMMKSKRIKKSLGVKISEEIYHKLRGVILDK